MYNLFALLRWKQKIRADKFHESKCVIHQIFIILTQYYFKI